MDVVGTTSRALSGVRPGTATYMYMRVWGLDAERLQY